MNNWGTWVGNRRLNRNHLDWSEDPRGRQKLTAMEPACLRGWRSQQLQEDRQIIRANTSLGEAINYALSQWTNLTVFVDHRQTCIDNKLTNAKYPTLQTRSQELAVYWSSESRSTKRGHLQSFGMLQTPRCRTSRLLHRHPQKAFSYDQSLSP